MTEKHIYAGNNTAKGFYSYFNYFVNPEEAKRIYILKGGPGVGKSSFMKKFGSIMLSKGYSVEYIHCSSDDESLDGIQIPEIKVVLVDGTAPHIVDPVIPGAADEIINLGIYLDNRELEKHKSEIIENKKSTSLLYKSAYRYFQTAGIILDEINSIYDRFTDDNKFYSLCEDVLKKIFSESSFAMNHSTSGKIRKLFSEAYTADGYISHTDSLCIDKKVWSIIGENENYASKLLDTIVTEVTKRGYSIECYYRPLNPEKLQHVYIPELNLMIQSSKNSINDNNNDRIDLQQIMDTQMLKTYRFEIENNQLLFDMLIKNALDRLYETKKQHELLEAFYKNSMDFIGVDNCFEHILSEYI